MSLLCYDCGRAAHEDSDDHTFYTVDEIKRAALMDPTDVAALVRDVARLRADLREYGRHAEGCSAAFNREVPDPNEPPGLEYPCKCGWDEVKL